MPTLNELNQESIHDEYSEFQAQKNLQWYLDQIGASPVIERLSEHELKLMADGPLEVAMDPLRHEKPAESDRDKIIAFYDTEDWLPKDHDEMLDNLPGALRRSLHIPIKQKQPQNIYDKWDEAGKKYDDALVDSHILTQAGARPDRPASSAHWLRGNKRAIYLLADNLMHKECLDRGFWPEEDSVEFHDRESFWRGFMLFAAKHGSDKVLTEMLNKTAAMAQKREHHMSRQYRFARIEGDRRPRLELAEMPDALPAPEDTGKKKPEIPPRILSNLINQHEAKDIRIEHHAEQSSSPQAAARKELGGKIPIRDENGKLIGSEIPDKKPSAHAWAVHHDRRQQSKRVKAANARRRWDTGPSSKAKGEIE